MGGAPRCCVPARIALRRIAGVGGGAPDGSGWEYWLDANRNILGIQLLGPVCERFQQEGVDRIDPLVGCSTVVIVSFTTWAGTTTRRRSVGAVWRRSPPPERSEGLGETARPQRPGARTGEWGQRPNTHLTHPVEPIEKGRNPSQNCPRSPSIGTKIGTRIACTRPSGSTS